MKQENQVMKMDCHALDDSNKVVCEDNAKEMGVGEQGGYGGIISPR